MLGAAATAVANACRSKSPDAHRDAYTSEEYWSWVNSHTSPQGTMQRKGQKVSHQRSQQQQRQASQQQQQQQQQQRPGRLSRPRMTRKLSADSLLDYRTYQLEDPLDYTQDARYGTLVNPLGRTGQNSSSSTPSTTLTRTSSVPRQNSLSDDGKCLPPAASPRIKDLQLARKPLQIKTEDFRLYQPDMEDMKSRFDVEGSVDGLMYIHILCGHGLKSSRTVLRDLYCVIEVDNVNKARTMIRTGAINFDWDEPFELDLDDARELSFLIYSWDPNTRHRLCFSSTMGLQVFLQYGASQNIALKLEPKGILYLDIHYQEPAIALQRTHSIRKNALFGVDLETIVKREKSGYKMPLLVKRCIEEVERRGLEHTGIYRLCGSARRKTQLKEEFERNPRAVDLSPEGVSDINVITGKPWGGAVLSDTMMRGICACSEPRTVTK